MGNARHFKRFGRGVFTCAVCQRATREAGQGVDHLCPYCLQMAELDNTVNDNSYDGNDVLSEYIGERDRLLKAIVAKGGNAELVKQNNGYLFPTKPKGTET